MKNESKHVRRQYVVHFKNNYFMQRNLVTYSRNQLKMFKILMFKPTLATLTCCRFNSLFITNVYKHIKLIQHNILDDILILLFFCYEFFMSLKFTVRNECVGSFMNIINILMIAVQIPNNFINTTTTTTTTIMQHTFTGYG